MFSSACQGLSLFLPPLAWLSTLTRWIFLLSTTIYCGAGTDVRKVSCRCKSYAMPDSIDVVDAAILF